MRKLSAFFILCLLPVIVCAQQGEATKPAPSNLLPGLSVSAGAIKRPLFIFGAPSAPRLMGARRPERPLPRAAGYNYLTPPAKAVAGFRPPMAQGGSGTVNSGTAGYFAFYASSGTAVSESPRLLEATGNTLTYSGAGGLDLTTGSTDSGQIQLSGATSGTVTLSVQDAAGTYTFKLPDSAGSSGQVLTTDGTGETTWATPSGGGSTAFDTLTSGSTVTWTFSGVERRKANLTLGTNATLSLSGAVSGSEGELYVQQDSTGGRALTLPANSYVAGNGAGVVTLSSAANAIDRLHFDYDGTRYYWTIEGTNYTAASPSITIGNVSTLADYETSNVLTISHNNNGTYLLVDVAQGYSDDGVSPTSVTFNGSSLTKIAEVSHSSNSHKLSRWRLNGAASGTHNVVLTWPSAGAISYITVRSFSGVNATTPEGTSVTNTGTSTAPTCTASSASGEMVVDAVVIDFNPVGHTSVTIGSGQTQDSKGNSNHGVSTLNATGATSHAAGASSVTMSWTVDTADYWRCIATPLKP